MHWLLWISGSVCFALFLWVATLNASVPWIYFVRHKNPPSWIPLLAGCFGAAALFLLPIPGVKHWWWLPFLLDWGSLPGIIHTLIFHLTSKEKKA